MESEENIIAASETCIFIKTENNEDSECEVCEEDSFQEESLDRATPGYDKTVSDSSELIKVEVSLHEDFEATECRGVVESGDVKQETEFIEIKVEPMESTEILEQIEADTNQPSEIGLYPSMLVECNAEVDIESDVFLEDDESAPNCQYSLSSRSGMICRFCKEILSSFKEHLLHMNTDHEDIIYTYYKGIDEYIQTQVGKNRLQCNMCARSYRLERSLKHHLLGHKGLCHLCCYTTEDYDDLKKHVRLHNRYRCNKCNYTSTKRNILAAHTALHLKKKIFQCDFCNYSTEIRTELKSHINSHSVKQLCCDFCDYKAYDRMELTSHMMVHARGKELKCSKCNFSSYFWKDLKKHTREHVREEQFQQKCNLCDFSTISKKCLKDHMRIHPQQRQFVCNVCERAYTNSNELKKHVKRHIRS